MTASGYLGLFLVHFFTKDLSGPLIREAYGQHKPSILGLHIISGSCLVLSWITLIILQNLQKCQKICCSCCRKDQVFQKTALHPNNLDELIYISKPLLQDIEMEVQVPSNENNLDPSILKDIKTLPKKLKNVASGSILVSDKPKQSKLKSKFVKNVSWIHERYFIFFQNVPISCPLNPNTTLNRLKMLIPIFLKLLRQKLNLKQNLTLKNFDKVVQIFIWVINLAIIVNVLLNDYCG